MEKLIFCIDSDGCAMDTMTYKHELFFGPIAAEVFGVEDKKTFQKKWEDINLYSKTRGVNRFVGLVMSLESVGYSGIDHLKKWVDTTSELSNASLEQEIENRPSDDLEKALDWSNQVNSSIADAEGHDKPFEGAKETLEQLAEIGKVFIVSSANKEAVEEEWTNHRLIQYVDDLYCQDRGKKADVISKLKADLDHDKILMVGDSPGDLDAAKVNDVSFYPIIVGQEKQSWLTLKDKVVNQLVNGEFSQEDEESYINKFWETLN